jgi:Tol biopolymer transport system component/predicted Ser/Thr protein kinase
VTLDAGTLLGPYEIGPPLGAGGMGEVYRAKDTRLGRTVAVKVLPADVAHSPDVRQRFEREARAISALNHPHICVLHDLGRQDGIDYLVMEYLEGETLAERLKKGALPLDQALRYGIEIAEALDGAHRQGIVHRDLKPGNVMITKSGTKLLDFGLAKLRPVRSAISGSTISAMATEEGPLTTEGSIVGTVPYMSPEQLDGQEPDARADIFALGAVLHEMVTGQRAFSGKTQASLIAAILGSDPPPVSRLQPAAPPALDRVVAKSLAKDPDHRWQSAHDLASELRWMAEGVRQPGPSPSSPARGRMLGWLGWAAAAALAVTAGILARRSPEAPAGAPLVTASLLPPPGIDYGFDVEQGPPELSPDGRRVAFIGLRSDGTQSLWVRDLSLPAPRELADTSGASYPFWSPDGRRIAYFARGRLYTMDASGGTVRTVCDAAYPRGGTWAGDVILFARQWQPLQRVAATGGVSVAATELGDKEYSHRFPHFLPDGKHFIFIGFTFARTAGNTTVYVGDLGSKASRPLLKASGAALYASPGWILIFRDRGLLAQRFNPETTALEGPPVQLVEPVRALVSTSGSVIASVSSTQALLYQEGQSGVYAQLGWYDRSGRPLGDLGSPGDRLRPVVSHSGRTVAADLLDSSQGTASRDIWLFDPGRKVGSRFTFGPGNDRWAAWSPDDRRIAFFSDDDKGTALFIKETTGTAPEEVLYRSDNSFLPTDWSRDGRFLALQAVVRGTTGWDIWVYSFADKAPKPFLQGPYVETAAVFSPDSRWLAYASDESGRSEVYVQPFPGPGAKTPVSTAGGGQPRWRGDGRELFYREPSGRFMAVPVTLGAGSFEAGTPQPLFALRANATPGTHYDVTADGQRFVVSVPVQAEGTSPLTLVLNWPALLLR